MSERIALTDTELRVLAVMIEKSLTQAAGYPMTLNSITLGANQKQNREPVVEYAEGDVSAAIRTLTHKGLVAQSAASPSARAVRFEHKVVEQFHWDKREQAVMAELMLRGRQTAGELRTHASRMTSLPDLTAVAAVLEALKNAEPRSVEELPREPGRSANRFRHLLGDDSSATAISSAARSAAIPAPSAVQPSSGVMGRSIPAAAAFHEPRPELLERVARLENEVAELRQIIARIRSHTARMSEAADPSNP